MFRAAFEDINDYIKERVKTLTGADLYALKKDFYETCYDYMGHTKDLTGITELLVNMYLTSFAETMCLTYKIERNYKVEGYNGHENELDVAFLNAHNVIMYGFSIKRKRGSAGWKQHELASDICCGYREQYSKNNIVQDLYRLDNIKRGSNCSFPTITFVFEDINSNFYQKMLDIQSNHEFEHGYIVLKGNDHPLWGDMIKKLAINT